MSKTFHLPDDVRAELSKIFGESHVPAIETACRRYLVWCDDTKPSVRQDGDRLMEISKKALELRELLKGSRTALDRACLHASEEFGKHDTRSWVNDLVERLRILDALAYAAPASERARNPQRGRPVGTRNTAERALAFHLWSIYRAGHDGKIPPRVVDPVEGTEIGPMSKTGAILGPILHLPSDLSRYFRELRVMDRNINSTK